MGTNVNNYKPALTAYARVFVIEGRARVDHQPEYYSSLKMGGVSQSFGDVTKVEIPDPSEYGKFIEVDRIRGAMERATFNLVGRFAADVRSRLIQLARKQCAFDVQLHIGTCTDPSAFNVFTKSIIAEDAIITTHSTDDLGALESGENAAINETGEISAKEYYEVLPLTFGSRASDLVTNHVNDVRIADTASCGTCTNESDGCQRMFAVTDAAGGSPGTSPDILYSPDGGATWYAHDVDTLTSVQDANSVFGLGEYVVVLSNGAGSLNYALIDDFVDLIDPFFTEITTGFVAGKAPNHGFSVGREAFIVGDRGYVYHLGSDPAAGVTVLSAGGAVTSDLNHVNAYDATHAVACGDGGAVIFTTDGESWDVAPTFPVGVGVVLYWCEMRTLTEWWVAASDGKLYYTLNSGEKWHSVTMPGTGPSEMDAVQFVTPSVGFAVGVVSSRSRFYQTLDGGYSWVVLPQNSATTIPYSDKINSIDTCTNNPNLVLAGGVADNSTDGILLVGS